MVEVDELVVVDEPLLALRQPLGDLLGERLLPRHELGVAAEQDVGAAAGHVGGDRDGALAAGLRDDLGLLRVVLGVQHDVRDAALLEQRREHARDFSIETVPTSTGWPVCVLLDDLVDDRVALLALGAVDEVGLLDADAAAGWSG